MDNLTHTVIGWIAGETLARATRSRRRVSLIVTGIAGGNLPDSDLLASYGGGKLGYLMQHRGYTHTIVGCLALALLLYGAIALWWRWRRDPLDAREHRLFLGAALLSLALHLGMDALNNYGVHPFWPFDDRWFYGDVLFIVEPAFWLAAAPLLLHQRSLAARIALGVVIVVALLLNVFVNRGHPAVWIGAIVLVAGSLWIGRRARPLVAATISAALCLAVTLTFFAASRVAAREVETDAARQFPDETPIDRVLTPAPMQPACWDVLSLQRGQGLYIARQASVVTRGDVESARCSRLQLGSATTAPWKPFVSRGAQDSPRVQWLAELSEPWGELAARVRGDCRAEALMQFVRAPYAIRWKDHWLVGDLRFDREAGAGFAEVTIGEGGACPRPVPWTPPRSELLHDAR